MALFSNFCNICYKIDNEGLKDISEDNMKHLKDVLITFVGHTDIINYNVIYLCQLCCEELTRVDKFREMCLSNLIQMRQRYINMKLKLEGNACAVQNTLQKFLYEEVLRKSSLEKSNCPVSISTECHGIIKCPEYVNKDCLVINRQVTNLQLASNECDINSACSEVSGINSGPECYKSRVEVRDEEDIKNEIPTPENTKLEKCEGESDEDFGVSDANNDNKSDTLLIEFIKEEFDLKNERENSDSENLTLKNVENESDKHANLDVKVPVVYNSGGSVSSGIAFTKEELNVKQENSASKGLELQTIGDKFGDGPNVAFEFVNVSTIVKMEEHGHGNITNEDAKLEMKLGNRDSNSKLTAATIDTQLNYPHVREDSSSSETLQSDARNGIDPTVEAHTCTLCNNSFRTSSCLIRHACTNSSARPYKCTVCNKTFAYPGNLTTHERIHTGDRPYKCTVCNKTFTQSCQLTTHKRIHIGHKPYKCTVCKKTFTQSSNLTTHKRIHSGDRLYKCIVCSKTFKQSCTLAAHERTHSGGRPYKCTVCEQTFTQLNHLTTHNRIHSGQRPYKCIVCNKTFMRSNGLTKHKRIHSGDRPYKCTVCNKTFTESCNFNAHKRIHSGHRPYQCTVCNKTFRFSSNLTRHERIHSGDRPYKCNACNKTYTQSSHLATHKRIIHSLLQPK